MTRTGAHSRGRPEPRAARLPPAALARLIRPSALPLPLRILPQQGGVRRGTGARYAARRRACAHAAREGAAAAAGGRPAGRPRRCGARRSGGRLRHRFGHCLPGLPHAAGAAHARQAAAGCARAHPLLPPLTAHRASACPIPSRALPRQPGESLAIYRARAQFAAERWGRADKLGAEDALRAQALSVVWANARFLGCRYPQEIETQAGCAARLRAPVSI